MEVKENKVKLQLKAVLPGLVPLKGILKNVCKFSVYQNILKIAKAQLHYTRKIFRDLY
jgi:hypothetical protein